MTLLILMAAGVAAAMVGDQMRRHRLLTVAGEAHAAVPVVHVGADEFWRPALEVAEVPTATVGHTEADLVEQTILADFDALIDSWRTDPPWLTEWRATVDTYHAAHELDTEALHRWRWGVVDVPTAEYRLVPADGGAA